MAFDNLDFRHCSYIYNEGNVAEGDTTLVTSVTKDIGNGEESCIKFVLTPMNTIFNPDVLITEQLEVYFQFLETGIATHTVEAGTDPLSKVPVEYRQGLFRLPRYADNAETIVVYKAERSGQVEELFLSVAQITNLEITERTDGSPIMSYSDAGSAPEAITLTFPAPTITDEYTVKRLTHSKTDFVTYQPSSKLTANLMNFQKEQEMFLLQEILWTIEMDMVTFTDLSGLGSVITSDGDGTIPPEFIDISIHHCNDVGAGGDGGRAVLYKPDASPPTDPPDPNRWQETSVVDLLSINDLSNVNTGVPVESDVLTWSGTVWEAQSIDAATESCGAKEASTLEFCSGIHDDILISDIFTSGDTFGIHASNNVLLTSAGVAAVELSRLKEITYTAGDPINGFLLNWNNSTTTWEPVDPLTITGAGSEGPAGGDTFKFTYNDTTSSGGIGTGQIRFNSTTLSAIEEAYVDLDSADTTGNALAGWLDSFNDSDSTIKGRLKVFKKGSATNFFVADISGVNENDSGFRTISFDSISSSLGSFTTPLADEVWVTFSMSGSKGDTGEQGDNGGPGDQGAQGVGFDTTGATVAVAGDDLQFTFPMTDPSDSSTSNHLVTLSDWDDTVNVNAGRILSNEVSDYGQYTYTVCLGEFIDPGSCLGGVTSAVKNGIELSNAGTADDADRTLQGIVYDVPDSVPGGEDERVWGKDYVTGNTIKLLPVPINTGVWMKQVAGVWYFSVQNVIQIKGCG